METKSAKNLASELNLYREQYAQIAHLAKYKFSLDCPEDEIISRVSENSTEIQRLKEKNDIILQNWIYPLLKDDAVLSAEEWEVLEAFAISQGKASAGNDELLALKIFEKILKEVRKRSDEPMLLKYLYQCGVVCFQYLTSLVQKDVVHIKNPYFQEGASYFPRIHEFDQETKIYILKCYNNHATDFQYYTEESVKEYAEWLMSYRAILNDEAMHKEIPDAPWDVLYRSYCQNALNLMNSISYGVGKQYLPILIDAAEKLIGDESYWNLPGEKRDSYLMMQRTRAYFYADRISIHELNRILLDIYQRRRREDDSISQIQMNMLLPSYLVTYLANDDVFTQEEIDHYLNKINENVYQYVNWFPFIRNERTFIREIGNFFGANSLRESYQGWHTRIEKILLGIHPPTFIHSLMVSEISVLLGSAIEQYRPSLLKNFPKTESFLDYIKDSAFLHDIGKLNVLDAVCQYGRKLMDEEFDLLKAHPLYAEIRLRKNEETKKFMPVAIGHHQFYNHKGGYPAKENDYPNYQIAVDIVTIADSIDAATDGIGRCYTFAKSLDTLITELVDGKGTRYNPDIVDIVCIPEVKEKIRDLLDRTRKKIYIDVCQQLKKINK